MSDVSEFWKYIMSDGVIYFLIQCYDEFVSKIEEGQALQDEYSIVKQELKEMSRLFRLLKMEKFFKTKFEVDPAFERILTKIIDLIPSIKLEKVGNIFRIENANFNTFNFDIVRSEKNEKLFQEVAEDEALDQNLDTRKKNPQGLIKTSYFASMKQGLELYFLRHKLDVGDLEEQLRREEKSGLNNLG